MVEGRMNYYFTLIINYGEEGYIYINTDTERERERGNECG
jgi:hypothetical protein